MNEVGFDLIEMNPQPLSYDYVSNKFSKYFKFRDLINCASKELRQFKFNDTLNFVNLYNQNFYYFRKGSFEINKNKNKPPILSENVSELIVGTSDIRINNKSFEKVYITPGTILEHYNIIGNRHPFSYKEKQSIHVFIYVPHPKFELSYIRIKGHDSLFRLSRADYSDENYYLLAGEWDKNLSRVIIDDLFKRTKFCDDYRIIEKSVVIDRKSTTKINNDKVKYIYQGGKNLMAAASQIFN